MVYLTTTVLYIPVVASVTMVYNCPSGAYWLGTSLQCLSSVHSAVVVFVTCVVVIFVASVSAGT